MKVTDKMLRAALKPYIGEAQTQLIIDASVIILIILVFTLIKLPVISTVVSVLLYMLAAVIFHYGIIIRAITDKIKGDYVTEKMSIPQFYEEYSFAGDRKGHSHIRSLYPKEKDVQKYKMKATNENGEEIKLRAVMSYRRKDSVFVLYYYNNIEFLNVTYLKRSKILLCVGLTQDIEKTVTKRKKQEIEKALRHINMSI